MNDNERKQIEGRAEFALAKARTALVLDHPFFGTLALGLPMRPDWGAPTAYTDGRMMGYNPAFVDSLPQPHALFLIAHELMHCVLGHQLRRDNREPQRWNAAADYAVNKILSDAGFDVIPSALIDPRWGDESADYIYARLPDDTSQQDGNGNGVGEVRDMPGEGGGKASPAEIEEAAGDWKVKVEESARAAKMSGSLPSSLDRLIDGMREPKVDWKQALAEFISDSMPSDYSWDVPNRRHVHAGLYLPAPAPEDVLPPVVIGVDTSGSIGADELSAFAAEISAILQQYRTTAHVVYCDARVQSVQEIESDDLPLTLEPKGGGGTEFSPVFDWVEENEVEPSCLIYLTDLYGGVNSEPDYPVLWVSTSPEMEGPFGKTLHIEV